MSDKVPNVVYKQEFFLPNYKDKTNQDKRNYYSSNKYDDYLKYVATGIKDLEKLDFTVTLTNEEAKVDEDGNENLDNNSTITLKVSLDDQEEIYTFKIVKEDEEEIKTEVKEEDNNSFIKKYEMIIGLGVFGIGVLSLLIAIITKTKKVK